MSTPKRIQLKRTKGWRLPEGAVVVTRPGKWGNPFAVGQLCDLDPGIGEAPPVRVTDAAHAVTLFRQWQLPGLREDAQRELAGRDLACWCPEGGLCHGNDLLIAANGAPA